MTENSLPGYYQDMENELNSLTVGHSKNINGHVVTRWSATSFEVDTWGRATVTLAQALALIQADAQPVNYDLPAEGELEQADFEHEMEDVEDGFNFEQEAEQRLVWTY